jgi:hypothetical protein
MLRMRRRLAPDIVALLVVRLVPLLVAVALVFLWIRR